LRIEWSFLDERRLVEALQLTYGPELSGILLLIGQVMKEAGEAAGFRATGTLDGSKAWWDNPFAFRQASVAASDVLDALKPPGDSAAPDNLSAPLNVVSDLPSNIESSLPTIDQYGRGIANSLLEEAATGRTRISDKVDRARTLHRALGHLSNRLKQFVNDEWMAAPYHFGDEKKES